MDAVFFRDMGTGSRALWANGGGRKTRILDKCEAVHAAANWKDDGNQDGFADLGCKHEPAVIEHPQRADDTSRLHGERTYDKDITAALHEVNA
jgi:hypothetical protein